MKRRALIIGIAAFAGMILRGMAWAIPGGPPAGRPILDTTIYQRGAIMNIDTATIRQVTISTFTNVPSLPLGVRISGALYNSSGSTTDNFSVVNAREYGAHGDCLNDDTAALQRAINSGKSVYIPGTTSCYKISTGLSVTTSGQRIFGEGHASKIVQTNVTVSSNSNVFIMSNVNGVRFSNLYVIPSTTSGSTFDGYGFKFVTTTACVVEQCEVSGHLRGAIFFYASNHSSAVNNWIHDGQGAAADAGGYGVDIFVSGGRFNTVQGNHIDHGSGTGIGVGTLLGAGSGYMTLINGNQIKHEDSYGIIVYEGSLEQRRVMISNNVVEEVTGAALYNGTDAVFGSCIYVNATEDATVTGNIVSTCSVNTLVDQLAPASIGFADTGSGIISNNTIQYNQNWAAISIRNINHTDSAGDTTVIGNNIDHTAKGIEIRDKSHVQIIGGAIRNVGPSILLRTQNGERLNGLSISGVMISSVSSGVEAANVDNVRIADLQVVNCTSYAINVDTITNLVISNNSIIGPNADVGSAGIAVGSNTANVLIAGNYITSNQYGMLLYSTNTLRENKVFSNTTNFTGAYGQVRTLSVNAATPGVSDGRNFVTANTSNITLTNFTGGQEGQNLFIVVTDTHTTFGFSSGSIKGNNGVNYTALQNDFISCLYSALTNLWYCTHF